jgi:dTDP-4-dehydrorhamnose reductase
MPCNPKISLMVATKKLNSKWIIWGANGFIGTQALRALSVKYPCIQVSLAQNSSLIVTDENDITRYFENSRTGILNIFSAYGPDYVLNCAAIASVEKCANNPTKAHESNVDLPATLATICRIKSVKFIHISTDAVFGQVGTFFEEYQNPEPISTYARTKYEAENLVIKLNSDSLIVRTRPLGQSTHRTTLLDFFVDNLLAKIAIEGHSNVYFTPIYILDLISSIEKLVDRDSSGIWHVTGSERLSKFEVGIIVADALGVNRNLILPTKFENHQTSTTRNLDTSLSNSKYSATFGAVPSVTNAIKSVLKKL